jgi:hypothetical protein
MAQKEIPYYNIDAAVGPNCPNVTTDVMLVQFFLHQIYSFPGKDNVPSGPKIKIDGQFGPVTASWIKHFQNEVKMKGKSIQTDGRVDPAKGAQFTQSSISHAHYTISFLNFNHCSRYRQDHNHLEKHTLIPGALKTQLGQAEPKAPGA